MDGGEWRLLDSCWGAGALMGASYTQRFAPVWFTSTPAEFGRRHFPTDPSYQLISDEDGGPVSWPDYILAPEEPTVYGDFDTQNFMRDLLQPATADIQSGGWVSFHIFKQCEHMSREIEDNYVYALPFTVVVLPHTHTDKDISSTHPTTPRPPSKSTQRAAGVPIFTCPAAWQATCP
jgi:hypothetical protein